MDYGMSRISKLWPLLATLVALVGCGGSGGSNPGSGGGTGQGTLSVRLADAPDPDITALNITIDRVQANVNGGWKDIETDPVTVNLLDLTKNDLGIGSANLPAGNYNQIRLFLSEATVTDDTGTHEVTVPSAAQTGLKLNVNYTISPETVTTLLLDFNVDKSLIRQGNGRYRLQPVIPVVVKTLSGTITGTAQGPEGPLANAQVSAVYAAGTSYEVGTEVNTSSTAADGTFKVWALLPGTYTLNFSFVDEAGNVILDAAKTEVVVVANEDTNIGTVTLDPVDTGGGE